MFVCAEIPPMSNPHLRKVILTHMMHGPCGKDDPECLCMKKKGKITSCRYSYPKQFSEYTTHNDDGYPIYRRRNTGDVVVVRKTNMDNRWVIPYNPYLSAMFDCHLNVEVCSTIEAVKYLYKYVYKGHDKISFSVTQSGETTLIDEIERFQSGRWVSPVEAAWRLFGFDLYEMQPPVLPLQVHMPNMQSVQFQPNEQMSSLVADERRCQTPLTEFFKRNAADPDCPKYLYSEFCEFYVWDAKKKEWRDRKRGLTVGSLAFVAPSEGERYHLRSLLTHVRGTKSFEDLLTVDGYRCASFQEAALKLGLLEEEDVVDHCLSEAVSVQMPHALRRLFATILIFCQPSNPDAIWQKYYTSLSEYYKHKFPSLEDKVLHLTIHDVERFLEGMGKSFRDFNLQHLHNLHDDGLRRTRDISDALDAPIPERYIAARKELIGKQREAYKCIIQQVKMQKPDAFFIDGPGGTGKTFLYCALYTKVREMGKIVLPTATSGIAATNLPSGRTAHSRFKIALDSSGSIACDVAKQGSLATLLKETSLIIWDEAPTARKENIEALDLLLRDLCNEDLPFGGKVVVLGGDFRQVLPVVPHKSSREAVQASLVCSHLWPLFIKFNLTENIRAREDPNFANFLLALGNGELQSDENDFIQVPDELVIPFHEDASSLNELMNSTFPEIEAISFGSEIFEDRAILTPKNEDVDSINKAFIEKFQGEAVFYRSFDTLIDDNCNIYPTEFLNTLCPPGMSPHELIVKENCPVILLRNIDPSAGLCNGTRLICKRFFPNLIQCEVATGHNKGQQVLIPRINLRPSSSTNYTFQFERKQFPIKLSFAMTINKSQGQTLNQVGIYLPQPCFSHGQLYVALSRARKASQVKVLARPLQDLGCNTLVKNVVSFEVLQKASII